jgi:hypothetical protein
MQLLRDFRFAPLREVLEHNEACERMPEPQRIGSDPIYAPTD